MHYNLKIERLFPATAAQLMQLLVDQKQLEIWTGEEVVFEAKVGGTVSLFGAWMNGVVQKISEYELSYTWRAADWTADIADTLVLFELTEEGEQTKLQLEHRNLPSEDEMKNQQKGWEDYFFVPLEDYVMVKYNAD